MEYEAEWASSSGCSATSHSCDSETTNHPDKPSSSAEASPVPRKTKKPMEKPPSSEEALPDSRSGERFRISEPPHPDVVLIRNDLVLVNRSIVVTDADLAALHHHARTVLRPWRPRAPAEADDKAVAAPGEHRHAAGPESQLRYTVAVCCGCSWANSWKKERAWEADTEFHYLPDEHPHMCGSEPRPRYMMELCRICFEGVSWDPSGMCCGRKIRASFFLVNGRWTCREWSPGLELIIGPLLVAAWSAIKGAAWKFWARCSTALGYPVAVD